MKLYIKDKVDGQEYCISGDKHFYLIEVTDLIVENLKSLKRKPRWHGKNMDIANNATIDKIIDYIKS